jgi:hypothetical protein
VTHIIQIITLVFMIIFVSNTYAGLPIEWSGTFAVDTIRIDSYKMNENANATYTPDSHVVDGSAENAKFQSYIFRLEPKIIVNDSATLKGELTVGNGRGGQLGENSTTDFAVATNGFTHYTRPSANSALAANQMYLELFADTAIYRVGRQSRGWGLGAVFDDGKDTWDRFITVFDGVQADFKFGNFTFTPQWAKINTEQLNSTTDVKEIGVSLVYDNSTSGMTAGIYYGSRKAGANNNYYRRLEPGADGDIAGDFANIGNMNLTIMDLFFKKKWEKVELGFEAPLFSGEALNPYGLAATPTTPINIKANAYVLEAKYKASPSWTFGINAGQVSGADGQNEFGAMYLNPNYQVAHLMFRYNLVAVENVDAAGATSTADRNVFESSITNATFAKAYAHYVTDTWTWKMGIIMAQAVETASSGSLYFNHVKGQLSSANATADQQADLGTEIDFGFDYKWNPNITLGGVLGWHMTGEYYGFDGTQTQAVDDAILIGLNLGVSF